MNYTSKLRFFSIGISAINKEMSEHDIMVVPIELVPMLDGELAEAIDEYEVNGEDRLGKSFSVDVNVSQVIRATWLPFKTNRKTPPDIQRGERVMLWQAADADKYYWSELGLDDDLRRLETVVYAWSATPDHAEELVLGENMYSLEVSTHGKHITLITTTADEEPTGYKLQFNTGEGQVFLNDEEGNAFLLKSMEHYIELSNAVDTKVILDEEEATVYANVKIEAGNKDESQVTIDRESITATANDVITVNSGNELYGIVKNLVDITCEGEYYARAPKMQFGEDADVEPSVLGDTIGDLFTALFDAIDQIQVIGNLGSPTSAVAAVNDIRTLAMEIADMEKGGDAYSKKNTNQ